MPDTVSTQKLSDGHLKAIFKFTNLSDGTGESLVKKIDAPALVPPSSSFSINKIHYTITGGMIVTLFWEATSNVRIIDLAGNGCFDFSHFSGLTNNAEAGRTGSVLLTTTGHAAARRYTLVIEIDKN